MKNKKAFSLVEILVVMSIFAVIGVLTTSAVSLTLRSGKKSDSLVRVRESVNYSMAVLERQIRNADSIVSCTGLPVTTLSYVSMEGVATSFSCITSGSDKYIASGSANLRLTSTEISVTGCSFVCTQLNLNSPPIIKVSITAEDSSSTSAEKGSISTVTEIVARNY